MRNASQQSVTPRARLAAAARRATPSIEPVERRVLMSATPGSLDTAFGTAGTLQGYGGVPYPVTLAVATQPNGDVVVAGGSMGGFVARYTPTGAVDTSFGDNGSLGYLDTSSPVAEQFWTQVFVLPNSNLLLFGKSSTGPNLVELTSTGATDSAFGASGTVTLNNADSVAVGADGSIYALENLNAVAKFTPAGAPDTTFGNNGVATLTAGAGTAINSAVVAVDSTGAVTVGVGYSVGGSVYAYGDAHFTPAGVQDRQPTVALYGFNSRTASITVTAIALEPDSTAYIAAQQGATSAIAVVTPTGGIGSFATFASSISNLTVQADGKVIAFGSVPGAPVDPHDADVSTDAWVERFGPPSQNVVPDTTFGTNGVVTYSFGATDEPQSIAIAPNGDILLGETTLDRMDDRFTIAAVVGGPGAVAGVLTNGVLTVTGTAGADNIAVQQQDPQDYLVAVNGAAQLFTITSAAPITEIVVNAGDGNDTVDVTDTFIGVEGLTVSVSGGAGDDTLEAYGDLPTTLDGGDGNDSISGGSYDTLPVTMLGGAGNDTLGFDDDVQASVNGGDGNDTIVIGGFNATRPETLFGGAGTDTLDLMYPVGAITANLDGLPDSTIGEGTENSTLGADIENLTIGSPNGSGGGFGSVTVNGDALNNVITVYASPNPVVVHGGDGNDLIDVVGGEGDALYGDAGNDTIVGGTGGPGVDTISGGAGTDTVDYSAQTAGVSVYLDGSKLSGTAASVANGYGDQLDGTTEIAIGGSGNDLLVAAPGGGDQLDGNAGNDTLTAQGGADALFGGGGNDTLNARDGGATYIDGGAGTDTATIDATGDTTLNVENVIPPTTPTPTVTQLTGTTYGTAGSGANTVAKATDGNLATFYDAPAGSGGYVAIDLGAAKAASEIKLAPRSGWAGRMVGGRFQASNTADFSSGVVTVYTVTAAPATGSLTTVATNTATAYRYWRYIGASYTYSDIAEFQLFGAGTTITPTPTPTPTHLSGTTYGTAGSGTHTVASATDGSVATFYDSPTGSGGYVAIDLGSAKTVSQIKFAPRAGWASRMVGGRFQASNTADFSGGVVTVYTVAAAPATGSLTTVSTGTATAYRYWRYIGANYTYSDIAEFELFA